MNWLLVIGYWLLVIGYGLLVIGYWLSLVFKRFCFKTIIIDNQLFMIFINKKMLSNFRKNNFIINMKNEEH